MNFFEQQAKARRRTGLLVIPFVMAVVLIIVTLNAVAWLALAQAQDPSKPALSLQAWLALPYWIWISLGTLAVICIGSLKTMLELRGGGTALAEMVGARKIDMDSKDADERRLINVVEEMSIASGTPMPLLYVLDDEPSINAFVAGLRPTETVLVVTKGAMQGFTRDEMQGVIGHEYSHVFNGDMRLNMRLMGVLAGILLIGQIGRFILRSVRHGRGKGKGQAALIGLAMLVVGYVGLFFGALIKAAISRQREFLADASSVQFTRNPGGIAGALYRIQQHAEGSRLQSSHADDVSHFCFGEAAASGFTSLMATHPPLEQRIKAIDPYFISRQRAERVAAHAKAAAEQATPSTLSLNMPGQAAGFAGGGSGSGVVSGAQIAASVGNVTTAHLALAEKIHAGMSDEVLAALHRPETAPAVCYALVLAGMEAAARPIGIRLLRAGDDDAVAASVEKLLPAIAARGADGRLPLVNLAIPALKGLPLTDRERTLNVLESLIKSDHRLTVFEFVLLTILREHLAAGAAQDVPVRYFKFDAVKSEIQLLIGVLARAGSRNVSDAQATYTLGMKQFLRDPGTLTPAEQCTLPALEAALKKLEQLTPMLKKSVVEACADCVIRDGKVLPAEAELLQAVAVALDCPMPPLQV